MFRPLRTKLSISAAQMLKDPYVFDFLSITPEHSERRWCTINKRIYNNGLDSEILA